MDGGAAARDHAHRGKMRWLRRRSRCAGGDGRRSPTTPSATTWSRCCSNPMRVMSLRGAKSGTVLFAAAAAPPDTEARELAPKALEAMRVRRARWFAGDRRAVYGELDDVFLTMEGMGQWMTYRYSSRPSAAGAIRPRGRCARRAARGALVEPGRRAGADAGGRPAVARLAGARVPRPRLACGTPARRRRLTADPEPTEAPVGTYAQRREAMTDKVVLLSGGNPQIAKGYGDAPVQAYIAADARLEKRGRAAGIDALVERSRARRAQGGEVELAVLRPRGRRLVSQLPRLREVREGDRLPRYLARPGSRRASPSIRKCAISTSARAQLDEAQFAGWVKQASKLPGERMERGTIPG